MRISPSRWLLLVLVLPGCVLAGEPQLATLDVPSMDCSLCDISVRKALQRVPGVVEARADSRRKRAEVKYDPAKVSPADLATALTKSGFPATVRTR